MCFSKQPGTRRVFLSASVSIFRQISGGPHNAHTPGAGGPWLDNEWTARMESSRLQKEIIAPKQLMDLEMGLITSYTHTASTMTHQILPQWVQGHVYQKKDDPSKITPMEKVNIQCNEEAKECVQQDHTHSFFESIERYTALLKLNDKWITSHV